MSAEKRYVVRLEYEEWIDNLFLAGPDTPEQNATFVNCLKSLAEIEKQSKHIDAYRRDAVALFDGAGFYRIAK